MKHSAFGRVCSEYTGFSRNLKNGRPHATMRSMKRFEILRVEKLSGAGSLAAALKHCSRERETPNAVPERRQANTDPEWSVGDGGDTARGMGRWRELTKDAKAQKRSVHALEYVITASPEYMTLLTPGDQNKYFAAAIAWVRKRHESEKTGPAIVGAWIHRDEQNPHLHVIVAPKVARKDRYGHEYISLGAREFTGDGKKLSQMQDDFHQAVGKDFQMERGVKGSKAIHETVKRHYGRIATVEDRAAEMAKEATDQVDAMIRELKSMPPERFFQMQSAWKKLEVEAEKEHKKDLGR